jgi:hypothetical protein
MILDDIILPILKLFLFRTVLERMPRAQAKKPKVAAGRPATDADEAMEDARAEVDDVSAAVETGESSGESAQLPPALLQRRLDKAKAEADKAKSDADKAIKQKEAMQKQMDDLRAELVLAKSNVGDVVQVAENPATPARKVLLVPLETGFDLALKSASIFLIQFCRRGRNQWQWQRFLVSPFLHKAASSLSSPVLARVTFVIFKES